MMPTSFSGAAGVLPAAGTFSGQKGTSGDGDFLAVLQSLSGPAAETAEPGAGQREMPAAEPQAELDAAPAPVPVPAIFQIAAEAPAPVQEPAETPAMTKPEQSGEAMPSPEEEPASADSDPQPDARPDTVIAAETPAPIQTGLQQAGQAAQAAPQPVAPVIRPAAPEGQPKTQPPTASPITMARALDVVTSLAGRPAAFTTQAQPSISRPAAFRLSEPVAAAAAPETAPMVPGPGSAAPQVQTATAVTAPVQAAAPTPLPLQAQLVKPLFTLAAAGNGEHVMTMKVTPEELGTVTVRAVIGPDGIRMELFAGEAGREAVKAIMPELRRELAASGMNTSLDLGSGARPETGADGRGRSAAQGREMPETQSGDQNTPQNRNQLFTDGTASLDVLA